MIYAPLQGLGAEDGLVDLTVRCTCGAVQGVARGISPAAGNHAVCYCDDCQAFAHFLGRAAEILDPQGGTEVFQLSPAALLITAGAERLACMRLSDRGLCRWYAGCCNTPIGNTMHTSQVPFVGLVHLCMQRPAEDPALQRALGPIQVRSFRRFAKGDAAALPADKVPMPLMVLRLLGSMLKWRLRGDHRRSPFFEPRTGKPIASPRVLGTIEREELRRRVERGPQG